MALYTVEVLESTGSLRALNLIGELTQLDLQEVKRRLMTPPLLVRNGVPLAEAVSCERQLRRMGVRVRVARLEIRVEDPPSSEQALVPLEPTPPTPEEVIEIPDEEVKVIELRGPEQESVRRVWRSSRNRRRLVVLGSLAGVLLLAVGLYLSTALSGRRNREELMLTLDQWSRTLQQQEATLDRGVSPTQIFNKLNELEAKISRLLATMETRQEFELSKQTLEAARQEHRAALHDLEFRRHLENAGYPIHPTCLVDRGMVQGVSDLPQGTVLRVQLMGGNQPEGQSYAVQIQEGIFKLVMEPHLEAEVYDARSTVAPLSQQPPAVRAWAVRTLTPQPLETPLEPAPSTAPSPAATDPLASLTEPELPAPSPEEAAELETTQAEPPPQGSPPKVEAAEADQQAVKAFYAAVDEWVQLIGEAEKQLPNDPGYELEAVYQKLLDLEARIDHLIQLIASRDQRSRLEQLREDSYGAYVTARHELKRWHNEFISRNNPFHLETAVRRAMAVRGWRQVQVLVMDTANPAESYVIEIEAGGDDRDSLLAVVAQTLAEEVPKVNLTVERIQLRHGDQVFSWSPAEVREAAALLHQPNGLRRCAQILGGDGSSP
ncbi:MAG: hypothetical protein C4524_04970 [Candidatus Zixiibacteriota bacterium]|nr:MAG: hypothetical protein C4524_04970 [candidate division Zixibacteria bacterium]